MLKLQYYIFALICVSCMGGKSDNKRTETAHLFETYLTTFDKHTLPFYMDRKAVFEMVNNRNQLSEIRDSFKIFIPTELKSDFPNSTFRSLYLFPGYNNIIIALILQEYTHESETQIIKSHVVTYNVNGHVIDHRELAGAATDVWEAFGGINNEYAIDRKFYQFRVNNDTELVKYFHLVETHFEYSIANTGVIENVNETKRTGYFEGDWEGYSFVKPLKE